MDDGYFNIEKQNPNKIRKTLIAFDDMMISESFIRGRKLNICLVFITQSDFAVPKNIRQNSTHYLIMKIPYKQELQQFAFNHLSDTCF